MDRLQENFDKLLSMTDTSFVRYKHDEINWQSRMFGLVGPRGVGKTTLFADIRGQGFRPENATVEFRSSIPLLEFRQYPYTGISLQAGLKGGVLSVETTVNDPNLAAKVSARMERDALSITARVTRY